MSFIFLTLSTVRFGLFLYGSLYKSGQPVCFLTLNQLCFEQQWGTFRGPLVEARLLLHWFASLHISLMLRFLLGVRNVVPSSLRHSHQF